MALRIECEQEEHLEVRIYFKKKASNKPILEKKPIASQKLEESMKFSQNKLLLCVL